MPAARLIPHRLAMCAMPVAPESVPALRRFARHMVERWHLPEAVDEAVSLIVTELATNVLLHSGSPDVTLLLVLDGTALTAEIRDTGRWKHRRTRRTEKEDAHAPCGRGLSLVKAYAPLCTMTTDGNGTRISAALPLTEPPRP